jgi:DNA mismatch repair protein MutS2
VPCPLDPDGHARRVLEFDKLLAIFAAAAHTPGGAAQLRRLVPTDEIEAVQHRQSLLHETRQALIAGLRSWPLEGIGDLRSILARATVHGARLDPPELRQAAETLRGFARLRRFLDAHAEALPQLRLETQDLQPQDSLAQAIDKSILETGEIADTASPELSRLRRRLVTQRQAVLRRLESHLGADRGDAGDYVTMRGERYVIPVRADAGHVRGIVHDRSSKGGTLFIEPLDVVDANNELQELRDAERREVQRILEDLTGRLGAVAEAVLQSLAIAERIDALHAAASVAESMGAARLRLGRKIRLREARHPLLERSLQSQSKPVVPLDLDLENARALVITGPNTGGKTVALKTVGLLVLMHQSGLQVPAHPDSELPLFERLVADIGDEQSIDAAESTFSSHLRHVRNAVDGAQVGLLALLDEFMAGTDPEEGAALAKVVLRHLVARHATALVTTHLGALKLFADGEPGLRNASMIFDAAQGTPLFRLQAGVPGSSNALTTAARLGFDAQLVEAARRERGENASRIEEVLEGLQRERQRLAEARAAAETAQAESKRLREEAAQELAELTRHRERHRAQARREAQTLLSDARARIESTVRELREAQASRPAIRKAQEDLQNLTESLQPPAERALGPRRTPQPGDVVWVRPLSREGRLERILGDGRALVRYGNAAVTVRLEDLEGLPESKDSSPPTRPGGYEVQSEETQVALEVDLRGLDRAEALAALEQFLDRAVLQGLPSVRIVHGKGTGVLRRAIQEHLTSHPSVASSRLGEHGEGGSGVTIVQLH